MTQTLPAEIEAAVGPASVYSVVADDQADPGTRDRGIAQIDIFSDQTLRALAHRIDQPSARAAIPVEQQIDARADYSGFSVATLPFIRGIVRDRRIRAAVP